MSSPLDRVRRFLRELRRRKVYRIAAGYLVTAFIVLQVASLASGAFGFPDWFEPMIWMLCGLGFPLAVILAWAFEVTPDGVRRTSAAGSPGRATAEDGADAPTVYRVVVGIGFLAAVGAGAWYLANDGGSRIEDRSVAVLPFESLGQSEASAFSSGVHGDVLTRLARVSGLRVTSRTSVLRYQDVTSSLPQIADELGVQWVVRGEVQESGGQVQVNVRLVDARKDEQVWAESYRRHLTAHNLFDIQSDITAQVARTLEMHLSPGEREQIRKRPTDDLQAYRSYTRGRSLLEQQTEPDLRQAASWFRRAIEQDSSYSLAWSGLADALLYLSEYGYTAPDSVLPAAREAVRRALALDSMSAEAHVSRAFLQAAEGNGSVLIRELRKAQDLRPSYAQAQSLLGWYYPVLGRPREGLASAQRAVELDPFAPEAWANVALGYLTTGRADSALAPARRAQELQGAYRAAVFYEGLALHQLGRSEEAVSLIGDVELAWAPPASRTTVALARLSAGDSSAAREQLASLAANQETGFYRGLLQAALGDEDAAFGAFRQIEDWSQSPLYGWPIVSLRYLYPNALGALRADPRHQELIRKINRQWGLEPDGSLQEDVDVSFRSKAAG